MMLALLLAFATTAEGTAAAVYDVTPTETGSEKKLVEFQGWYVDKDRGVPCGKPDFERKDFQQVGLAASYRKIDDELWFPVSFGTEFRLRVRFGYARTLTLSVVNSDFRRTAADSNIRYER